MALIEGIKHGHMDTNRKPAEALLDVARALLLLQGAILLATTIESVIWGFIFPGAGGQLVLSGGSAAVLLVARVRLHPDRTRSRRLVYLIEGLILGFAAVDIVLALALIRALPPLVALSTQFALPLSVITLLRRSSRVVATPIASRHVSALEVA
ncbi:MAG TPA: hypothetical protein VF001_03915 [Candidatus Limnocylindria bacterium]